MRILGLVAAIGLMATASGATPVPAGFTAFYGFGDSLTEPGRAGPSDPPYVGNRFSNGPVWAEILGAEFADAGLPTANYALGGATAGGADAGAAAGVVRLSNFQGQIGAFAETAIGFGGANPLVGVLFGANDLFAALGAGVGPAGAVAAADAVADGIRSIRTLGGATYDDFLVLNVPGLDLVPAFFGQPEAEAATDIFNDRLEQNFAALEAEGINILPFDFDALLEEAIADPAAFGFAEAMVPCVADPRCLNGDVPVDSYLFIDGVHPTAAGHAILAAEVTGSLGIAPVPVPASGLLLLGVIGCAIAVHNRRG